MMNLNELYAKISANFWKESQVTSWVERYFYRKGSHQQTSSGTGSGNLPVITLSTGKIDPSFYDLTTIEDADFTLVDDGDNTKKAQFQLSGISAGATRIITIPNGDFTIAGLTLTQTLSNKTLVTPTIASLTNAQHNHANAAGGGNIPSTSVTGLGTLALLNSVATANLNNNAVTLAKMQQIATDSFLGRDTASTGDVEVLTPTQLVAIISSVLDDTFMLRSGGAAAQMTGALLLSASDGINFMNLGGSTLTAGSDPEVIAGGGIEANGFLKLTTSSKTIAAGVITATHTLTSVDTEAAAATDDLDTINGGALGHIIIIRAISSARTIVIKDATGNISCPGDRSLTHVDDVWTAVYNGARWCEISFADNAA